MIIRGAKVLEGIRYQLLIRDNSQEILIFQSLTCSCDRSSDSISSRCW